MKKTTFAILLTILITLACAFAACNTKGGIIGQSGHTEQNDQNNVTDTADIKGNYNSIIEALEDQILEIKQDQYISESKRAEEIARLEALILELKQSNSSSDTDSHPNTEKEETTNDTESGEDTKQETNQETSGKFIYIINGGKATITGYTGSDRTLSLPSSIDGYPVEAIGDDAFESETLQSLSIPEGVTKIGWFAFKSCPYLRTVTLPQSIESIGYSAFPTSLSGFSIICPQGSFAAKYAESYGISVTVI